jgi:hypothetical protein
MNPAAGHFGRDVPTNLIDERFGCWEMAADKPAEPNEKWHKAIPCFQPVREILPRRSNRKPLQQSGLARARLTPQEQPGCSGQYIAYARRKL